jgi:Fe-S oxidoreductase
MDVLKNDFKQPLGKVAYHVPCHSRVQLGAMKTGEAFARGPGHRGHGVIERCSGHAGTWGVKKEFHQAALKIGRPVVRQIAEMQPDYFASDCQLGAPPHRGRPGARRWQGQCEAPPPPHPEFASPTGLPD